MSAEPLTLVPGLAPAAPIMRVLSQFDRAKLETFAEVAIALLDLADGDPDLEVTGSEDDFANLRGDGMPGCPIADAAEIDDEPEEDDPQGACDEDEISTSLANRSVWSGPGCPIADPAEGRQDWQP